MHFIVVDTRGLPIIYLLPDAFPWACLHRLPGFAPGHLGRLEVACKLLVEVLARVRISPAHVLALLRSALQTLSVETMQRFHVCAAGKGSARVLLQVRLAIYSSCLESWAPAHHSSLQLATNAPLCSYCSNDVIAGLQPAAHEADGGDL